MGGDLIFITDANWGSSELLIEKADSTKFFGGVGTTGFGAGYADTSDLYTITKIWKAEETSKTATRSRIPATCGSSSSRRRRRARSRTCRSARTAASATATTLSASASRATPTTTATRSRRSRCKPPSSLSATTGTPPLFPFNFDLIEKRAGALVSLWRACVWESAHGFASVDIAPLLKRPAHYGKK